jgi:hypothetical protein
MCSIEIDQGDYLVDGSTAVRDLRESLVGQTGQATFFITIDVAAKGPVAHAKDQGCFFLGQASLAPPGKHFFKTHQSGLL